MTNYDFLNLSPDEFETLTRDLMQRHLNIRLLESFTRGRDGGIDLRHITADNSDIIIQCKRYKKYSDLKSKLKEEIKKVQLLNPSRYILITSVGLTPKNKDEISDLFGDLIQSKEDILGREDLNNLLTQYQDIERNHFKLWLSSTNVLNTIINRGLINYGVFSFETIKETSKFYVQNASFFEATELLKHKKYVIISGIPGIGKTTLAGILSLSMVKKENVEELFFLSDSIKDGYKVFDEEKRQLFIFDDFLGSNFLQTSIGRNEDSEIIQFINKVKRSDNKYLIFTTREYILKQAQQQSEKLANEEFVKCIIDLSKYTNLIKAKILYNHLFFNDVPLEYVREIIRQELLFPIIEHKNYNPRIIESFTNSKIWQEYTKEEFPQVVMNFFNNPQRVWEHAFENTISEQARIVLYLLLINGGELHYKNLQKIVENFSTKFGKKYNVEYITKLQFKQLSKSLENTFITINKGFVSFHNPSIQDFLINYINQDNSLKMDLIQNFRYLDLTLKLLTFSKESINKIYLDFALSQSLIEFIIKNFDELDWLYQHSFFTTGDVLLLKINLVNNFFGNNQYIEIQNFSITTVEQLVDNFLINSIKISSFHINIFIPLIVDFLKSNFLSMDFSAFQNLLNKLVTDSIEDFHALYEFTKLRAINPNIYDNFLKENSEIISEMLQKVIDFMYTMSDSQDILNYLIFINDNFSFDCSKEIQEIEKDLSEIEYDSSENVIDNKYIPINKIDKTLFENAEAINRMFSSYSQT